MDGQTDEWREGWSDGWIEGKIEKDRKLYFITVVLLKNLKFLLFAKAMQLGKEKI